MPHTLRTVGIQADSLGGSFHEIAALEYFAGAGQEANLQPFATHQKLVDGLRSRQIEHAVMAVDNTDSGRVISAVEATRGLRHLHVAGSITIPVEQHVLLAEGMTAESIQAVLSQRPALDQCSRFITEHGLQEIEAGDTLGAALDVFFGDGVINGLKTAAIASRLAGITAGLTVGPMIANNPNNATKFWHVTTEPYRQATGTHAAITFEIQDMQHALSKALEHISKDGEFDITDIDSHLRATGRNKRSFYAEISHPDGNPIQHAIRKIRSARLDMRVLGVYTPISTLEVNDTFPVLPQAITHDEWNKHHKGLDIKYGSQIVHVEFSNQHAALLKILQSMSCLNISDMSRPTVPNGNQFARGFYFVLDARSTEYQIQHALDKLGTNGFTATRFTSGKNGKLTL